MWKGQKGDRRSIQENRKGVKMLPLGKLNEIKDNMMAARMRERDLKAAKSVEEKAKIQMKKYLPEARAKRNQGK